MCTVCWYGKDVLSKGRVGECVQCAGTERDGVCNGRVGE